MFEKCPCCGYDTLKKQQPSTSDSLFIGSCEEKDHSIYVDKGIICDFYLCSTCGNIQLRAKVK